MSRKSKSIFSRIKFEFETSLVGKQFNKILRNSRKKKIKGKKSSGSKVTKGITKSSPSKMFKLSLLLLLFVFLASIAAFPIWKYYSFTLSPSPLDKGFDRPDILDDRLNILIAAYEDSNEYSFLDFVGLMSVDRSTKRVRFVLINADFSIRSDRGGYIELRRSLARSELLGSSPLDDLSDVVSVMLGIQVDRYMVIKSPDLIEAFDKLDIGYVAPTEVRDQDVGVVREGEFIDRGRLAAYLAAEEEGNNAKMARIVDFLKHLAAQNKNMFTTARFLWNIDFLVSRIQTNLSKSELLQVTNILWGTDDFAATFIDIRDVSLIETGDKRYYVPNTSKVDEKIRPIFVIPEVVREQVRIEVYNATGVNGLAARYKRWLENLGATVVRTSTYPDLLDETVLYNADQSHWRNSDLVKRVTRGEVEELNEVYPFNHSGQLILVLGKDVLKE